MTQEQSDKNSTANAFGHWFDMAFKGRTEFTRSDMAVAWAAGTANHILDTPRPESLALYVHCGSMHESNGRVTWLVTLSKDPNPKPWDCHEIYSSASEGRARYEEARLKHFLGQGPAADILAFDTKLPATPVSASGASTVSEQEYLGIEALYRGDVKCSDELPKEKRPQSINAKRLFRYIFDLKADLRAALSTRGACPYCTSTNDAVRGTFYDQTCAGCVARMGAK